MKDERKSRKEGRRLLRALARTGKKNKTHVDLELSPRSEYFFAFSLLFLWHAFDVNYIIDIDGEERTIVAASNRRKKAERESDMSAAQLASLKKNQGPLRHRISKRSCSPFPQTYFAEAVVAQFDVSSVVAELESSRGRNQGSVLRRRRRRRRRRRGDVGFFVAVSFAFSRSSIIGRAPIGRRQNFHRSM